MLQTIMNNIWLSVTDNLISLSQQSAYINYLWLIDNSTILPTCLV